MTDEAACAYTSGWRGKKECSTWGKAAKQHPYVPAMASEPHFHQNWSQQLLIGSGSAVGANGSYECVDQRWSTASTAP